MGAKSLLLPFSVLAVVLSVAAVDHRTTTAVPGKQSKKPRRLIIPPRSTTTSATGPYPQHHAVATPYFTATVDPRAVCLDGTSGVIYVSPSPSPGGSRHWMIGSRWGGWCSVDVPLNLTTLGSDEEHTVDHCYSRSMYYKGSSRDVDPDGGTVDLTGELASGHPIASRDPAVNPTMHDWNFAWMLNCDGTGLAGRREEPLIMDGPAGVRKIHLAGGFVREAAFEILRDEFGLGAAEAAGGEGSSTDDNDDGNNKANVVITGQSAGGLAALLFVDWWDEQINGGNGASAGGDEDRYYRVLGFSESGFFLDWDANNATSAPPLDHYVQSYHDQMRYLYDRSDAYVHPDCAAAHHRRSAVVDGAADDKGGSSSPFRPESVCLLAQHAWPYLRRPVFVATSRHDAWQLEQELGYYESPDRAHEINAYGAALTEQIVRMVTDVGRRQQRHRGGGEDDGRPVLHGAFVDSCQRHCGDSGSIDGTAMMEALSSWINAHVTGEWDGVQRLYVDGREWPCEECCPGFEPPGVVADQA